MNIYTKLFKLTSTMDKMKKDTTNPFYGSKYFDINALLEALRPELIGANLLILQPIENDKVVTRIIDVDNPAEFVESSITLPNIDDPQKLGSAITYFRRYTLGSLLGIEAEDDDGNKAIPRYNNNDNKEWLNEYDKDRWMKAEEYVKEGGNPEDIFRKYKVSKSNREYFKSLQN